VKKQMTRIDLEDDKGFIEIIKNSLKKVRTKRGLFFLAVYVLAFIFAIVALILTIFTLPNVGGSESVESTRILFRDFGYPLGSLIFVSQLFLVIFIFPFLVNVCISILDGESFYTYVSIVGFSIIEAYAFLQLSCRFLDMFNDIAALQILSNRANFSDWHDFLLKPEQINSISTQIFLVTLVTVFTIRVMAYIRENKL